jgi:hypothetical protein
VAPLRASHALPRVAATVACLAIAACTAQAPAENEHVSRTSSAIIAGKDSDPSQDSVVMLVYLESSTRIQLCTAALLAPDLILTARHCISTTDLNVQCAADGKPIDGGGIGKNHEASKLFVFKGSTRPDLTKLTSVANAKAKEIVDDGAKNLCDHDIALVILDKPLEDVPLAAIRLDGNVDRGESLLTVGWGVTDTTPEPKTRQQRSGVVIARVGPDGASSPVLTPNEFLYGESICVGDSGGPVFAEESGAVVGVVSRGGNGSQDPSPAASCTDAVNISTKTSSFKSLIMSAYEKVGAQPKLEVRKEKDDGCQVSGHGTKSNGAPRSSLVFAAVMLVFVWLRPRRISRSA